MHDFSPSNKYFPFVETKLHSTLIPFSPSAVPCSESLPGAPANSGGLAVLKSPGLSFGGACLNSDGSAGPFSPPSCPGMELKCRGISWKQAKSAQESWWMVESYPENKTTIRMTFAGSVKEVQTGEFDTRQIHGVPEIKIPSF